MRVPESTATLKPDLGVIDKLLSIVGTGRAILFTGAGFSFGCENMFGNSPPMAKDLAHLIAAKGSFEQDDDLSYVSDYFLTYKNKHDLLHLLKEYYTIVTTKPYHQQIASLNWKRIYTTNYDNSIEQAALASKKLIYSLTADDSPKEFYRKRNCCIHINGSISSVSENDMDTKFKLTRTSYVSPDSFSSSLWYYYFKKDLEQSSAIVFIGYSLYDIDVESILYSSQILKSKTYFIIGKSPSNRELFTLSKYGQVLPVGVDGFAEKIKSEHYVQEKTDFWLDAFSAYKLSDIDKDISDDEILNFILHGSIASQYIDNAISANQAKPFLIIRRSLEEIERILTYNNSIALVSDFGNGKSIILQEAMASLATLGKQVFFLQSPDGDYVRDIEKINELREPSILVIDDYSLHLDILIHIAKFNSENIKVIFSDRSNNHDRLRTSLIDAGLQFVEIGADNLDQDEIAHFVGIIDNLGFWGDKANLPQRKIEYIKNQDRGQISHALLDLFNSPQIRKRIESLITPIIINDQHKATIFSICLLEVLNLPTTSSLVSEVSGNDSIYRPNFRALDHFNHLFAVDGNKVISKSSLLSMFMINNYFSAAYITDKLLAIAEKFDKLKESGTIERELFISLLRFSFAERLMPAKGKLNSLVKYYEELKVRVGWLKFDPHYWLQYGMARMNYGELGKAQSNLDEAYVLASKKRNYDTSYIDTQQARLYILRSMEEQDGSIIWNYFSKAHSILASQVDDVYKCRQVTEYKRFYEKKYSSLSQKNKKHFLDSVIKMKNSIEKSPYFHAESFFNEYAIDTCFRYLCDIISKIQGKP